MIFKIIKVQNINRCHAFREEKGSPRDPRGDQKGATNDPRAEQVTLQTHQYSLSKTIILEARGVQKAPQGAPKATSKFEEKTKTKKNETRRNREGILSFFDLDFGHFRSRFFRLRLFFKVTLLFVFWIFLSKFKNKNHRHRREKHSGDIIFKFHYPQRGFGPLQVFGPPSSHQSEI